MCQLCANGTDTCGATGWTSCLLTTINCPIPDENCVNSESLRSCAIRKAVDDYYSDDQTIKDAVILKYGNIEEWDVSQITNFQNLFLNKASFNGDISKWQTGKVINMHQRK